MRVACYQGTSFQSRLIRWLTRSDYSHVAVVLRDGRVVEAWDSGVRVVDSLSDQHTPGTLVDVFEFTPALTEEQEAAGERYLLSRVGRKYDWKNVFRFVTKRQGQDNDRDFCSELLANTAQVMGVNLFNRTPAWMIPPDWVPRSLAMRFVAREVTRWTNFHAAALVLALLWCWPAAAQDNTDLMYRVVRAPNREKARALLGITNFQGASLNLSNWSELSTNVLSGLGGSPTSGVSVAVTGSILGARTNGSLVTISNKVEMNPGTVTTIIADYGLTGGVITSSGSIGVDSNTIPSFTQMTNWLAGLQQTNTVTLSNVMTAVLDHSRTNTFLNDMNTNQGVPGWTAGGETTNYTIVTMVSDGSLYTLDYYSQMQMGFVNGTSWDAYFDASLFYTDLYGPRTNQLFYANASFGDYDYMHDSGGAYTNQYAWHGSLTFQAAPGTTIVISNGYANSLDTVYDLQSTNISRYVISAHTNRTFTYRGMVWPP